MILKKECKVFEAEHGQTIGEFAEELIEYINAHDVYLIGIFNGVPIIVVSKNTTVEEIVNEYLSSKINIYEITPPTCDTEVLTNG